MGSQEGQKTGMAVLSILEKIILGMKENTTEIKCQFFKREENVNCVKVKDEQQESIQAIVMVDALGVAVEDQLSQ